ncbi:MAG: LacI family DNA-binding transcriptional regulator [Micropruina sp.]
MGKRPTQGEVARVAGVSTAVVSYVLNNGPRPVSEDARRRVLAAMAQTGYRPNNIARALAHGQSSVLGLVVPDLANLFGLQLAQGLARAFSASGYSLLIGDSGDDADREVAVLETVMSQQVAGLVWYGVDQPLPVDIIESTALPVVLLNAPSGSETASGEGRLISVNTDERGHADLATTHLIEHGRGRIAHLGGPAGRLNARERARGWTDALRLVGLAPAGRCAAPFTREGGFDAVPALLELDPDAVLASNEMQAIGLIAGLHRAGVRVPDDIAVVGLNGTASARFTVPALTAVHLSIERLAVDIADALAPGSTRTTIETDATLVLRDSCGCRSSMEGDRP